MPGELGPSKQEDVVKEGNLGPYSVGAPRRGSRAKKLLLCSLVGAAVSLCLLGLPAQASTTASGIMKSALCGLGGLWRLIRRGLLLATLAKLLVRWSKKLNWRVRSAAAVKKLKDNWKTAFMIPVTAAFVGWFTNWLAVQMIFLPTDFFGIPFRQFTLGSLYGCDITQPLGMFGWQGIVPAKAAQMANSMVTMVTTQLVDVSAVFGRLEPDMIAKLLKPELPSVATDIGGEILNERIPALASVALESVKSTYQTLPAHLAAIFDGLQSEYLAGLTLELQKHTDHVIDLKPQEEFCAATGSSVLSITTFSLCFKLCATVLQKLLDASPQLGPAVSLWDSGGGP
ncbi:hypothetical protein CYMTET_49885 [Cymbomonas tetramitiformis]|uniref:Uncharacterized protein n=1 Tax=Cymbomonas tetramitiformis TaxID=36881 RepID=A0AAE0EVC7_9CHLO|nr:hypothetical protein CYMTET_49885 [Cymbomonas tetramitiformis]